MTALTKSMTTQVHGWVVCQFVWLDSKSIYSIILIIIIIIKFMKCNFLNCIWVDVCQTTITFNLHTNDRQLCKYTVIRLEKQFPSIIHSQTHTHTQRTHSLIPYYYRNNWFAKAHTYVRTDKARPDMIGQVAPIQYWIFRFVLSQFSIDKRANVQMFHVYARFGSGNKLIECEKSDTKRK
jgi:hypothetical protein